jgi:Spy/CpxP family protein refolding chaperone
MQAVDRASWQNPKVLTTLLLVFVAGAFTGALSMRWGLHERLHPGSSATWKDPQTAKLFLGRCRKDLNLTPKQAEEMSSILDDYKLYYQSVQDQLDEVRSTGKSRIMALLNPEQKRKFEQMLSEGPK